MKNVVVATIATAIVAFCAVVSLRFGTGPAAYLVRQSLINTSMELSVVLTVLGLLVETTVRRRATNGENIWLLLAFLGFCATAGFALGTPALYRWW